MLASRSYLIIQNIECFLFHDVGRFIDHFKVSCVPLLLASFCAEVETGLRSAANGRMSALDAKQTKYLTSHLRD